jgi:serine/threonine protein kinase
MAPEATNTDVQLTTQADIYSFGIMMWVLLTGQTQIYDSTIKHLLAEVAVNGLRPPVPSDDNDLVYKDIMQRYLAKSSNEMTFLRCWRNDPKDRPKAKDLLALLKGL